MNLPASIQQVIQHIVQKARPKQVILFGSRATGKHRENSDFDICVIQRSCTDAEWDRLLVELAEDPWTLYPIDLVEFEKLNTIYQTAIQKEGIILYG